MNLAYLYHGIWVAILLFLLKKRRDNKLYIFIVFVWTLSSFASLVYGTALGLLDNLRIAPYMFLFCCLFISFYPFYRKDSSICGITIGSWHLFKYVIIGIGIISILPFIENLLHVITTYNSSNSDALADVYSDKMSGDFDRSQFINWFSFPGRICNAINLKLQFCTLFFLFLYVCTSEKNKLFTFLLSLGALNPVLYQLNMSGRSTLVWFFIRSLLLLFILYGFLKKDTRAQIVKVGVIGLAVGIGLLSILTLARYNANEGANSVSILTWLSLYIGESSLNFNNDMWDINVLTQGDNSFSFFKNILGFDTFTDYLERRAYWGPLTGVDPVRFYSFIGDFFSDIYFFTLPLVFVVSFFLRRLINKSPNPTVFSLYLYYTWGFICTSGITCYTLKTNQSMIDMTVCLIVVAILSVKQSDNLIIRSEEYNE